jgi:hypothetical protein
MVISVRPAPMEVARFIYRERDEASQGLPVGTRPLGRSGLWGLRNCFAQRDSEMSAKAHVEPDRLLVGLHRDGLRPLTGAPFARGAQGPYLPGCTRPTLLVSHGRRRQLLM